MMSSPMRFFRSGFCATVMTCVLSFGRTMSPVSAVVVYGSGLVGAPPLTVIRHLLPALLAGGVVAMTVALR